jgi:hypothetical protein
MAVIWGLARLWYDNHEDTDLPKYQQGFKTEIHKKIALIPPQVTTIIPKMKHKPNPY